MRLFVALLLLGLSPLAFAATLVEWQAPTQNSDGSPLTDLQGYRIHWGPSTSLTNLTIVEVPDPKATSYLLDLPPGTWYVRMASYSPKGYSVLTTSAGPVTVAGLPACPPAPAVESRTQACTVPLVGSWTQTRTSVSAPAPACWTPGEWLPATAPAGTCASAQLLTSGPLAYELRDAATTQSMVAVGLVPAGLPCGPEVRTIVSVKYCRIQRSQVDVVVWPTDLSMSSPWARAKP